MAKTIYFVKIQGASHPVFFSNWAIRSLEKKFDLPLGKIADKFLNVGELTTGEVLEFIAIAMEDGYSRQGKTFDLDERALSDLFENIPALYKTYQQVFEIFANDVLAPVLDAVEAEKNKLEAEAKKEGGKKKSTLRKS